MPDVRHDVPDGETWIWLQRLEDLIVLLFTARGALTGLIFFTASLMGGASLLKASCIFLLTAWLHAWGYGSPDILRSWR